jgi:protein AroM
MLGLVTIGQSPRDDVVASMFGTTPPGDVVEAGALDDLDRDQIDALAPRHGEPPLVTRLLDGSEVIIGKTRMLPLMEEVVRHLEARGCDTICVLCTGEFPRLGGSALVIYPDRLVSHVVEALLPEGTLGVVMPHEGQHEGMLAKWTTPARSVLTAVASPYSASEDIATAVRRLVEAGAQAIVLDCMGFDRRMLADARSATSKPVLLSNGLVGSILRELLDVSVGLVDSTHRA